MRTRPWISGPSSQGRGLEGGEALAKVTEPGKRVLGGLLSLFCTPESTLGAFVQQERGPGERAGRAWKAPAPRLQQLSRCENSSYTCWGRGGCSQALQIVTVCVAREGL